MRQVINIKATGGHTGCSFNVLFVHQVNDQVYVLLENDSAGGGGGMDVTIEKKISVKTNARKQLPVKFFFINSKVNQSFTIHGHHGVSLKDADEPVMLNSIYDYLILIKGSKCLHSAKRMIYDLGSVAKICNALPESECVVPEHIVQKFGLLQRGIVKRLIRQQPCSIDMLNYMHKAEIFDIDDVVTNYFFVKLIIGLGKLERARQQQLLKLFSRLDAGRDGKTVLTPFICDALFDDVFKFREYNLTPVEDLLRFVEQMSPLTQEMATIFFMNAYRLLALHEVMHKIDASGDSERYLYAHTSPSQLSQLSDSMKECDWLPKEVIPFLASQLDDKNHWGSYFVISGLKVLHNLDMLATHLELYKNSPNANAMFNKLKNLTKEDVNAVLNNPAFYDVIILFGSLDLIGQWAIKENEDDVDAMLKSILHHTELTQAVSRLAALYKNALEQLTAARRSIPHPEMQAFKDQWTSVIKVLIATSKAEQAVQQAPVTGLAFTFFQPAEGKTLAEIINEFAARLQEVERTQKVTPGV